MYSLNAFYFAEQIIENMQKCASTLMVDQSDNKESKHLLYLTNTAINLGSAN